MHGRFRRVAFLLTGIVVIAAGALIPVRMVLRAGPQATVKTRSADPGVVPHPLPGRRQEREVSVLAVEPCRAAATADSRLSQLECRKIRLQLTQSSHWTETYEIALFRDPNTGLAVWQAESVDYRPRSSAGDLPADSVLALTADRLIAFRYVRVGLWIRESQERYASLDAAQLNITAALEHEDSAVPIIDPSLSRIASRETYFVSLWKRFPELVASGKENANPTPTRIQSLERTPGGWELRLRTKNKSLSIFLSKQYDLVDSSDSASVQHVNHLQMVEENAAKREIVATREGRKTTLTLRIALLQVLFRDGEWRMLFLKTLYDPTSKLFWWETVVDHEDLHTKPTHQSMIAGAERQADFFAEGNGVFVGSEKIAVFAPSRVSESRAHFSNYRAGMAAALEQIEKNRGQVTVPSTDRSVHSLNPLVDVPKDFLLVCGHASPPPPTLTGVSRENGLWQITFAGAGHSAAVFLTDDYQIVRTVLSPAIPYPAVEETLYVCPIAASREGQETTIQARHIRISMYSACRYNSASPLVDVDVWIYFDPQTGLFFRKWGYASDSRWDATSLVLYLTGNELIEFQTSYDLGVRQGAERYTTVDDGVTHLLSELWLEGALDSRYGELIYDATLRPHLPEQFFPPPDNKGGRLAIESVSHKPDGWHLVVRGANDKRANVTLDKDLKVIDVKSQQ